MQNKRHPLVTLMLLILAASMGSAIQADLYGDSVRVRNLFPDRDTELRDFPVIVSETEEEIVDNFGGLNIIDIEGMSFTMTSVGIEFEVGSGANPCNCVLISDIDWPNIDGAIIDIVITASFNITQAGFTDDDFEFGSDWVLIDLQGTDWPVDGTMTVELVTTPQACDATDSDADGAADNMDNCQLVANPDQIDSNGDGYGNVCDGDFNNDCIVNFLDISAFADEFLGSNADFDLNNDGAVNFLDYARLSTLFLTSPGPSSSGSCE